MTEQTPFSRPALAGAVLAAAVALAGCSGGGGSSAAPTEPLTEAERTAEFIAMTDRLAARFNTAFTGEPGEMPTSGTASFTGYTGVAIAMAEPLALLGDITLEADFGARTLTGEADNFFGEQAGLLGDYTGTVALSNGEIGIDDPRGSTVPNDIRFDYAGTLTGQGNTVVLDGSATGKFKGTPIRGLLAADVATPVLVNGVGALADVAVAAEID